MGSFGNLALGSPTAPHGERSAVCMDFSAIVGVDRAGQSSHDILRPLKAAKGMTHAQLYLAVGVPTLVLALGMIGNGLLFNALSARMSSLEARMLALE